LSIEGEAKRFVEIFEEEFKPIWKMPNESIEDRIKRTTHGLKAYRNVMKKAVKECPNFLREIGLTILTLRGVIERESFSD